MTVSTRPLVILGAGRIARALLGQLLDRAEYLREVYNLELPVAAVANSHFLSTGSPYLGRHYLEGVALGGLAGDVQDLHDPGIGPIEYVADVGRFIDRAIVVDLTAANNMAPLLLSALDSGLDVVLANKKPLCADFETFLRLTRHTIGRIGYEATVGAGLPIVQTIRTLYDAGDSLIEATCCLSGTLGYVCSRLEEGVPLSRALPEARARGYTEPDPRDDLSGADVRRKALIMARTLGQTLALAAIPEAPIIPLEEGPLDEWLAALSTYDEETSARAHRAEQNGAVLRYVMRLFPDHCDVGLREVPLASAIARVRGIENSMALFTRFYNEHPLTISGPGAGPDVTAAAVLGDIIRLSA